MKIAINVTPLNVPKRTGIQNYFFNLCKYLPLVDKKNEYIFYAHSYRHYKSLKFTIGEFALNNFKNTLVKISRIPAPILSLMWERANILSAEYLIGPVDIFHTSEKLNPPLKNAKLIMTIFDITPIKFEAYHKECTIKSYANNLPKVLRKVDMVIAISQCTKNDILEYFGNIISEDRIRVVPLAADEQYRQINDENLINEIKTTYKIYKPYILFVGTLEPRKNITNLIRAYNILPASLKRNYHLVICGKKGWYYDEIFETIKELKLEDKVIFTGYVPDDTIPLLMNGAEVFVYPSFYEGFGLPPLEAMSCGTPVISSNISSIPEVVGDAGILINPKDIEELSDAITRTLNNGDLKRQLISRGLQQAKKFSWEKTAKETLEVYNMVSAI